MDKYLPRSLRRLLVMTAFAAANHNLSRQVESLSTALPLLITDEMRRHQCEQVIIALLDNSMLTPADYNPVLNILTRLGHMPAENNES